MALIKNVFLCICLLIWGDCYCWCDEIDFEDDAFASFFDEVIIPANQRKQELDPRISVNRRNASALRECASSNKRILEADHRLIIIGGGPAGLSAGVYAARAEMKPLIIFRDGGQLESSSIVDNYPGFDNGVDTIEFLDKLTHQAERFGAKFHECDIKNVDIGCRPFRIECHPRASDTNQLDGGTVFTSSALIIATGATAKWLNVKGESHLLSRGVHTCATCDGFFYKGKHAVVIGGGDTAMEQALFLARMVAKVTVIHRRNDFRASKAMATRVLNHPKIDILWNTRVIEFISNHKIHEFVNEFDFIQRGNNEQQETDDDDGGGDGSSVLSNDVLNILSVSSSSSSSSFSQLQDQQEKRAVEQEEEKLHSLLIEEDQIIESIDLETGSIQEDVIDTRIRLLKVDGVFVAIGHVPNTQLFDDDPMLRRDEEGYVYTIPGSTVTSVTGVYAAGDVADHVYRQAITSAGTGAMAAMDAERWLCEHGC